MTNIWSINFTKNKTKNSDIFLNTDSSAFSAKNFRQNSWSAT